jgi:hypothetical protein
VKPGLARIDHLVFAAPRLEAGMDAVERRLGVRPVPGGRHPAFGTHNALVALGPRTYLEIIAPDPGLDPPPRGRVFGVDGVREPRLVTWALADDAIDDAAASELGPVEDGRRERPDGTVLAWRLTDPYAMPLDGAVPFLISWGSTPHPAGSVPRAGTLCGFRIEHPDPDRVRRALTALGAEVTVREAGAVRLVARISTPSGEADLS